MGYLISSEFRVEELQINKIDKLFNKFCAKDSRIKSKLHQLIEKRSDVSVVFELESLINNVNSI